MYTHRLFDSMSESSGFSFENEVDRRLLCATLLFLVGKLTENHRRLRDVVNVTNVLFRPSGAPPPEDLRLDGNYALLKNQIVKMERQVLIALRFEFEKDFICTYLLEACDHFGVKIGVLRVSLCLLSDWLAVRRKSCSSKQLQALALLRASHCLLCLEWGAGEERFKSRYDLNEEEAAAEMQMLADSLTLLYSQESQRQRDRPEEDQCLS